MAFDLDAFLKDLGVTGEEETAVRAALGKPERLTMLEKNQLRQTDYSREQDKLRKAQSDLEAQRARLDAEAVEWASLSAAEKKAATDLRASLEAQEAKVLTLTQRVTRLAAEAGLDPAKALEGIDQPAPKPDKPAIDLSGYVKSDDVNRQLAALAEMNLSLPTELMVIAQEHEALTGEKLDPRTIIAEMKTRFGTKGNQKPVDARSIWEEMNKIPEKRAEKSAAQRAAELAAAKQQGYDQARSEAALPIPPSAGIHSPVLRTADGKPRESVLNRPAPESSVRAAAQALATGKYRQQPAGAAK